MEKAYLEGTQDSKPADGWTEQVELQRTAERRMKQEAPLVRSDPKKAALLKRLRCGHPGSRTETQVALLLESLLAVRDAGLHTLEIRDHLGVPHPAGRVQQLRDRGHEIVTGWARVEDEAGDTHRVAVYTLVGASA